MKKRATLKDIANALNVSITTVSRALNNKEDISDETKKTVLEVAQMLNYKPNAVAVSLRKKSDTNLVGVILPSVEHYFYSTILNGIVSSSKNTEHMIIIGESSHQAQKEKTIIQQFVDHYVCGIIFAPSRELASVQNIKELERYGIPHVLIDRSFEDYNGSYVQYDDHRGGFMATEHLVMQGYRKIAHIRGDKDCSISESRYLGYRDALLHNKVGYDPGLVRACLEANEEEGYQIFQSMWTEQGGIEAVFAITDNVALGIYEFAREHGISIPENLAIVGYSNSLLSRHVNPSLTTVEQNGKELGTTAFRFLLDKISTPGKVLQKTFTSSLIVRESSFPRRMVYT